MRGRSADDDFSRRVTKSADCPWLKRGILLCDLTKFSVATFALNDCAGLSCRIDTSQARNFFIDCKHKGSLGIVAAHGTGAELEKISMSFNQIFVSAVALCIYSSPIVAQQSSPDETASFVKHETHCAQFLGGEGFGDGVSYEYSESLGAALGKSSALYSSKFEQIRRECSAELASRSRLKIVTATKDSVKPSK